MSPESKQRNLHDDRADVVAMLAFRLMQLRTQEALDKEKPVEDFSKVFGRRKSGYKKV